MSDARECLLDYPDGSHAAFLAEEMGGISADYWFAGWMKDLEFMLWDWVTGKTPAPDFYRAEVETIAALHELCGGWIIWDPAIGAKFIPTDEWLKMVEGRT